MLCLSVGGGGFSSEERFVRQETFCLSGGQALRLQNRRYPETLVWRPKLHTGIALHVHSNLDSVYYPTPKVKTLLNSTNSIYLCYHLQHSIWIDALFFFTNHLMISLVVVHLHWSFVVECLVESAVVVKMYVSGLTMLFQFPNSISSKLIGWNLK
jgi:hypothetical protein